MAAQSGRTGYVGQADRERLVRFTDLVVLKSPWDALAHPAVLIVLGVLLAIEFTVDKIPAVDTVNDVIQTLVRPVAGAILFAASGNVISHLSPVLAMICGLLIAGGVHAAKAAARPAVTAGTLGVGNPVVSLAEDVVSGVTTFVAVIAPVLLAALAILVVAWIIRRRRKRRTRR